MGSGRVWMDGPSCANDEDSPIGWCLGECMCTALPALCAFGIGLYRGKLLVSKVDEPGPLRDRSRLTAVRASGEG
jgi:hypothetical protein